MIDFNKLLATPTENIKRPPPLPNGTYFGKVGRDVAPHYEYDQSSKKKTPLVRYFITLTEPGDDVDQEEYGTYSEVAGDLTQKPRVFRKEFYLTSDAQFRAKEFCESCGVPTEGRSLGEILPEVVGADVMLTLTKRMGEQQTGKEIEWYNDIGMIGGRQED